jgi:hypothetical protein
MQESRSQVRLRWGQRIEHPGTFATVADQAGVPQGRQVPRNSGLGQTQLRLQVTHAQRAAAQELQNFQPDGLTGRFE